MRTRPRGIPFTKNDARRGKSPGRPRKSVSWKAAEDALREAIPRILMLSAADLEAHIKSKPNGADLLAIRYIEENPSEVVNRFLGKVANVLTGEGGKPLIPASIGPQLSFEGWTATQIDAFITATGKRA